MKLTNQNLLWLNSLTFILMIGLNMAGGAGWLNGVSVAEVSDQYQTLLTPAGYAFIIWSVIYLLLAAFLWYQWKSHAEGRDSDSLEPTGIWLAAANVLNTLWIIAWVNAWIGLSLLLIIGLFVCLFQLVLRLRLEIWDAPTRIIFFVWWPICIYMGWITLALALNFVAWLKAIFDTPPFFSAGFWAIIALATLTSIYLLWTQWRSMREASLVGVWGFIAIAVNQWQANWVVGLFAVLFSILLLAVTSAHALSNKATWPSEKLKRGE
ncbi:MAG: hypothetical protein WBP46_18395 [Thiolinea sp.]